MKKESKKGDAGVLIVSNYRVFFFNLNEVNRLISILLEKHNINFYVKSSKSGQDIVHCIANSGENRIKYQKLVSCYILPSLLYRIGL